MRKPHESAVFSCGVSSDEFYGTNLVFVKNEEGAIVGCCDEVNRVDSGPVRRVNGIQRNAHLVCNLKHSVGDGVTHSLEAPASLRTEYGKTKIRGGAEVCIDDRACVTKTHAFSAEDKIMSCAHARMGKRSDELRLRGLERIQDFYGNENDCAHWFLLVSLVWKRTYAREDTTVICSKNKTGWFL